MEDDLATAKFMEEAYGLNDNPFLDDTAKEQWLDSWTDREEQIKIWQRILNNAVSSKKNFMTFIIGDYGRGKTQSLLKIYRDSSRISGYYSVFLNFKGEEKSKPGLDFIVRIFKSIDFDALKTQLDKNVLFDGLKKIPDDFDEVRSVLMKIFLENEDKKIATYFIKGEINPSKGQLQKLGILRKIDDIDIAKEYLAGFLIFLKNVGFTNLLLAVDEFEYLFSLVNRSQYNIYLALLRGLYDFPVGLHRTMPRNGFANMVFFIAVSEDAYVRLKDLEKQEKSQGGPIAPLMDRIDAEITLSSFSRKDTETLVENRLRFDRIQGKFENKPLIPFSEDFIDFIYQKSNGELRSIINLCSQVLDVGLEKGVKKLDADFAQRALEERSSVIT
jgi:hypothetical protein